jgi:hypothetical protein
MAQAAAPAAEKVPGGHLVHVTAPCALKEPAAQLAQAVQPAPAA